MMASEEMVAACLDGMQRSDAARGRWARIERDPALDRAREMDSIRQHGLPLGPLHGVPVAIDERFPVRDRAPHRIDSARQTRAQPEAPVPAVVERLLEAGAVIIGASRVRETGLGGSGPAYHPRDARRSAGGPCGNWAAAVEAREVPLAVICDAQGDVIRSASYCGVFGFRPTRGVISRRGAASLSSTLDQVGILGRTLEDVAVLADVLGGYDAADDASRPRPRPRMHDGLTSTPPVQPCFLWLDMPYADRLSAASRTGFDELCDCLGTRIARFPAPAWFGRLPAAHRIVVEYEVAAAWRMDGGHPDSTLAEAAHRGVAHGEEGYRAALAAMDQGQRYFSELFNEFDSVITPAAAGQAPLLELTEDDDPVFGATWALCGLPTLCVPLLEGESGMPIGVQLVGSAEQDDRLLRTTRWLLEQVQHDAERTDPEP